MTTSSPAHAHRHDDDDSGTLADMLDLDGFVTHHYLAEVLNWVEQLVGDAPIRRVLDLGAGTGVGTIALAQRFADAEVIALDASTDMLERIRRKAQAAGLIERVHQVLADLDDGLPSTGTVELAWASASLHELGEPQRVLDDVFARLAPGGLFVVAEMDAPPRFLPADIGLGRPGLESRLHEVLDRVRADRELRPDWGPRLAATGFVVLEERSFLTDLASPPVAAVGHYASGYLRRVRGRLDGQLASDDLAVLDTLLADHGPDSLVHRGDLNVRGNRTVWAARRR